MDRGSHRPLAVQKMFAASFLCLFLFLFLFSTAPCASAGVVPFLSAGEFLVASRQLNDPVFGKTVILLVSYDSSGAMGLIVNRPSSFPLSKLFPRIRGLKENDGLLYVGGPVQMEKLFLLIEPAAAKKTPPGRAVKIFGGVYLSTDVETFKTLAGGGKGRFRMYAGYAGWAAGQLESEISRGNWYLVTADAGTIFNMKPESVWPHLIGRAGFEVRRHGKDIYLLTSTCPFIPGRALKGFISRGSGPWSFQKGE